jgi:hypothetical protein
MHLQRRPMSEEKVKWISSKEQIDTATPEELERVLLTCDGNGVIFKKLALEQLKKIIKNS